MKKKAVLFVSSILVSLLFIITPIHMQVSAQGSEESIQATQTRSITVFRFYGPNDSIPGSISYNSGGWKGTLYRTDIKIIGGHAQVTFKGSVSCSGVCPIPTELEQLN